MPRHRCVSAPASARMHTCTHTCACTCTRARAHPHARAQPRARARARPQSRCTKMQHRFFLAFAFFYFFFFRWQSHAAARSVLKALTRSVRCVEPRQPSASQLLAFCFLFSGTLLSWVTRQGSCPRDCFCPKIIVVALRHFSYLLAGRAPRVASPTSACLSVLA